MYTMTSRGSCWRTVAHSGAGRAQAIVELDPSLQSWSEADLKLVHEAWQESLVQRAHAAVSSPTLYMYSVPQFLTLYGLGRKPSTLILPGLGHTSSSSGKRGRKLASGAPNPPLRCPPGRSRAHRRGGSRCCRKEWLISEKSFLSRSASYVCVTSSPALRHQHLHLAYGTSRVTSNIGSQCLSETAGHGIKETI